MSTIDVAYGGYPRADHASDFLQGRCAYLLFVGRCLNEGIIRRMVLSSNDRSVVFYAGGALIPRSVVERIEAHRLNFETDEALRKAALEVFAPVVTLPDET
jgi:hypothetical protein